MNSTVFGLLIVLLSSTSVAEEVAKERIRGLDEQTQEIKSDVLDISKNIIQLEEKLIYPPDTQISIFLSVAKGEKSRLNDVKVNIDGKEAAHHIYSSSELGALQHGGVQRIYIGNIRPGEHALEVSLSGKSAANADFQKRAGYKFSKDASTKLIEIVLASSSASNQAISFKD